jgi:hypothetical protein
MPLKNAIVKLLLFNYDGARTHLTTGFSLRRAMEIQTIQATVLKRLNQRRDEIDGLMKLHYHDPQFVAWKTSIESLAERLDEHHRSIIRGFDFWPNRATFSGETSQSPDHIAAYKKGLQEANVQLGVIIEEMEDFGPPTTPALTPTPAKAKSQTINFVINTTQATNIQQQIKLDSESPETQALVRELLGKLKNPEKDVPGIKNILSQLVETATPVLIKILLVHFGLGGN